MFWDRTSIKNILELIEKGDIKKAFHKIDDEQGKIDPILDGMSYLDRMLRQELFNTLGSAKSALRANKPDLAKERLFEVEKMDHNKLEKEFKKTYKAMGKLLKELE